MFTQQPRPLADTMPEATGDMSLGEVNILQALKLVVARLDDVVQPAVLSNSADIKGLLDVQKNMVTAQESLERVLRNGIRVEINQTTIDLVQIAKDVDGLAETIGNLPGKEVPRSVWSDILDSIMKNKKMSVLISMTVMMAFPLLQKIASAVVVSVVMKWFGVDLPAIIPWLFG